MIRRYVAMTLVAVAAAVMAVAVAAQGSVSPISMSDLTGGGWSNAKHYALDPKSQEGVDKFKIEADKKVFDKKVAQAQKVWAGAKAAGGKLFEAGKAYKGYKDLMEEYDHLTPKDGPYDPSYQPPGTPEIPSSCAGSNACGQCFESAQGDLTAVRIRLEKLRVLYASTKAWIDRALAFGDNMASAVGIGGLAWQTERSKMAVSVANLERSYDNKYTELMATLEKALRGIAACEASHFKNPDWYDRFGFMFYTFMADRYRR